MNQSVLTIETGHEVVMESSPYGIDKKKLGIWVFIVSDALTFATFLFGYGYMRVGSQNWGTPFKFSTILNGIVMTFILLSSSLTMLAAVRATQTGQKGSARKWLGLTMLIRHGVRDPTPARMVQDVWRGLGAFLQSCRWRGSVWCDLLQRHRAPSGARRQRRDCAPDYHAGIQPRSLR